MPRKERLLLLVEKSPEDRRALCRQLGQDPEVEYRVLEAATALTGLAAAGTPGIDCLLLDHDLPDLDGLAFLNELTGGTGVAPFPIVLLANAENEAVAVRALQRGAHNYLVKGTFSAIGLCHAVEAAIDQAALRRELQRYCAERERLFQEACSKDEFLALLAHELRNPMASIANAVNLVRRPGIGRRAREWAGEVLDHQVRHMTRLVEDLLDVSRITRGKVELRRVPIDLTRVVAQAVAAVQGLMAAREHQVRVVMGPGPIGLVADPARVEQVLVNLLTNAAKYTERGGSVALVVEESEHEVVLRVRDSGIGIEPGMLTRVFEPFTQADRSTQRSAGGLGIGLTLVRRLAELHGGSAEAFSAGLGQGSEFVVRLPRAGPAPLPSHPLPAAPGARPGSAPDASSCPEGPRRTILVVDDNAFAAQSLAALLELEGHQVHLAYDGPGGLEAALAQHPDVVLLDIGLPDLDGHEIARRLRTRPELRHTCLVAVTGYGKEEDRFRARQSGFDHHLTKPVNLEQLRQLLAQLPGVGS